MPSDRHPAQMSIDAPSSGDLAARLDERAHALGVSREAVELSYSSDVVDLHIDTFIWARIFGYALDRQHGTGPFDARLFGQADLPRCLAAGLSGAYWIITTNPLRSRRGRRAALFQNLARLEQTLSGHRDVAVVRSASEYRAARASGRHAALIGVQGGNALELSLDDFDSPALSSLTLVTLLHFTRSRIGAPALPEALTRGDQRLSAFGVDYIRKLNQRHILVDLAHLSRTGFWDAIAAHEKGLPLTVSHTACNAVHRHFRNLDDDQLRAVAETGGLVGVLFNCDFLGPSRRHVTAETVVDHLVHIVRTIGEDHAALGSDFDGAILPPRDLKTVLMLPRLVDAMLRRGLDTRVIQKILGQNFLRVLGTLRP